jgi:general secretion pathway protein B
MSLILDALKRAERERQAEPMPASAPRDVVAMPGRAPAAPRPGVRLVSVFVFGGGLALAALLLWDAFRTPPPAPPAPVAAAPAPVPAAPSPPVIKASPPPTVVPGTETVASLDDLSDEPELEAASAQEPAPKPKRQKPVSPKDIATRPAPPPATAKPVPLQSELAAPAQAPPPAAAPPVQAQPLPQAQPQPEPQPAPAPAAPQSATPQPQQAAPPGVPSVLTLQAPLRKFREMPPDYRADFPALRVEIHVYEKEAARRFVMVNGRKYREGERMAEGPALLEIVADGMVLEYRGEKVLYTLGR